jgi:hypothetical protein
MRDRDAERRLKPRYPAARAHIKRRDATQHSSHPWIRGLKPTATFKGRSATVGKTILAPGAKATFKVTFAPKAKGARSAGIAVSSSDADENPFDIGIAGEGVK